jgi:hypothetical protein
MEYLLDAVVEYLGMAHLVNVGLIIADLTYKGL